MQIKKAGKLVSSMSIKMHMVDIKMFLLRLWATESMACLKVSPECIAWCVFLLLMQKSYGTLLFLWWKVCRKFPCGKRKILFSGQRTGKEKLPGPAGPEGRMSTKEKQQC